MSWHDGQGCKGIARVTALDAPTVGAKRIVIAWLPGGPPPILRLKDVAGLQEWRERRWVYFDGTPLISDVTDSVVALGPELAAREDARVWQQPAADTRLSAFTIAGYQADNTTPAYVQALAECRRLWRHTALWFRPEPMPVVVLDPAPADVEVRRIETDLGDELRLRLLFTA